MSISLIALVLAAAPAGDHQRAVEQAVFEICPQVLAGTFALEDETRVAAAGYRRTEPRRTDGGLNPRIARGEGDTEIVVSASSGATETCAVWFGGSENRSLFRAVRAHADDSGYRGTSGPPLRLGDGTAMHVWRTTRGGNWLMTVIEGDAGGEVAAESATTVVLMNGTN